MMFFHFVSVFTNVRSPPQAKIVRGVEPFWDEFQMSFCAYWRNQGRSRHVFENSFENTFKKQIFTFVECVKTPKMMFLARRRRKKLAFSAFFRQKN